MDEAAVPFAAVRHLFHAGVFGMQVFWSSHEIGTQRTPSSAVIAGFETDCPIARLPDCLPGTRRAPRAAP